jgi:ubiquinone/menaquinone biosynthesis C-methylase UbiE
MSFTSHPTRTAQAAAYLMESTTEGDRLEAKTDPEIAREQLTWAGLRPGMQAVDVGCGTGAVTRIMARMAMPGAAIGIDVSADRLNQARRLAPEQGDGIAFLAGDANTLPIPDNAVDFAWSRFLFEYLSSPERALAEMLRVTRPGGVIAVADLDNQLDAFYPLDEPLRSALALARQLLGTIGFDPWVGRKLFTWFQRARLEDIRVCVTPHQIYAGGLRERDLANWRQKLATAADRLAQLSGESHRWEFVARELLALLQRPDGFYYSTLVMVRGTRPMP